MKLEEFREIIEDLTGEPYKVFQAMVRAEYQKQKKKCIHCFYWTDEKGCFRSVTGAAPNRWCDLYQERPY